MTVARSPDRPARRLRARLRRGLIEGASVVLVAGLLIWSLVPVYNMLLIALAPGGGDTEFAGRLWPPQPSLDSFRTLLTENYWYLEHFWRQLANSLTVGLLTMLLTVCIGSLAGFALGRTRLRRVRLLGNVALLTYVIPGALLVIPFLRIMQSYGLADSLWAVVAADVMFATPFAILIFQQYGKLIPMELDEAARIDGAAQIQVYRHIYLPLMAPVLAAVGIYALLLAWNGYLYQSLLLSAPRNWTVAVTFRQFFSSDDAPWNDMMAMAIVYALPPIAIFYTLRRYMVAGLTMGGVTG